MTTSAHERELWPAIRASIDDRAERMIRLRRRLHATPEASGTEVETTALVAETLREAGLSPRVMASGIGVIVDLDLGAPGGTFIATRCELDCVQVNDDKQVAYASTRPGLCHACGHDAHSTMSLAAALALHDHRDALRGLGFRHNVRLIFQPAEETAVGARAMIQQGAISGVEGIIALHVEPFLPAGTIGLRTGPLTAACKLFQVTVRGRGGHSARPHEAIDPIPAATGIVDQFYRLGPRSIDSRHALSLTVSSISTRSAAMNAIPDEAHLAGTLRTTRVDDTDAVQRRMQAIVEGMATATGCDIRLDFTHACPPTDNDPQLTNLVAAVAHETLDPGAVRWIELPSMGGEDFAFYQELIPGVLVRLGAAMAEERARRPLHSSLFDINESALVVGTRLLTRAALRLALRYPPGGEDGADG